MPRRAAAVRRETQPDAKFNNRLVTQLINKVHALTARSPSPRTSSTAPSTLVQEKTGEDPLTVFKKAMDNVRPTLECKPKRVGGATYQVPMEVNSRSCHHIGDPLDRRLLPQAQGAHHARASRATRSSSASNDAGAAVEEARGHVQDGRSEPCVLALPLLKAGEDTWLKSI